MRGGAPRKGCRTPPGVAHPARGGAPLSPPKKLRNKKKYVKRKLQKRYWIPDLGKREFWKSGGAVRRLTDLGEVNRKRRRSAG